MVIKPIHLGDGAYVHFDGYHVVLTANHHDPHYASDTVKLDPGTMASFYEWMKANFDLPPSDEDE